MKQYKGYYIDKVIFNSEEEIDNFIKEQAVEAYKMAVKLFCEVPTSHKMEISIFCDEKAGILVNNFGYTWEEVEALEIETLEAIA